MEAPIMEAAAARTKPALVTVSLTITDENGDTQIEEKRIPDGPTKVTDLKAELGVPAESALWVIAKSGKRKQLGDHETHNVKQDDRYETLVRGGVS
jgi:hypothetical protein